jgi:hypothetical protein
MLQGALNLKDVILEYYDNYPDNAYAGEILNDEDWGPHLRRSEDFWRSCKWQGGGIIEPVS